MSLKKERYSPALEHFPPSDHLLNIHNISPSLRSTPSLLYSLRIYDTPVHLDGAKRKKDEGKVSGEI